MYIYGVVADSEEEEALDIIIAEVVNNGLKGYFYEVDEVVKISTL